MLWIIGAMLPLALGYQTWKYKSRAAMDTPNAKNRIISSTKYTSSRRRPHSTKLRTSRESGDKSMSKFVPGFIAVWAIGYLAIALAEIAGPGLGDVGGYIGAGFTGLLLMALVGAAAYETFRD
jgi:hypothetical protein